LSSIVSSSNPIRTFTPYVSPQKAYLPGANSINLSMPLSPSCLVQCKTYSEIRGKEKERECEFGNEINDTTRKKRGERVTKSVFALFLSTLPFARAQAN
jgi:hypothetical protein